MGRDQNKRIKEIFDSIHKEFVPCFHWQFHSAMYYRYNVDTNCIECDFGLSMPVALKDEELNEKSLMRLINEIELKIYKDYKKMGWDIGWYPD